MIPFADITTRWAAVSTVPIYIGSIPEGTLPPYAVWNVVQSNQTPLNGSQILWSESLMQLSLAASQLVDVESMSALAQSTYNFAKFGKVVDMTLLNRSAAYSESPSLTGNRIWIATLEFRIRH